MKGRLGRILALIFLLCMAAALVSQPRAAALADGVYQPEAFSFSGGTGKVKISCKEVTIENGEAWAEIFFSSSTWSYVRMGEERYDSQVVDGKSRFFIPVRLGQNNTIHALTTRMSSPHEVEYTLFIQLGESGTEASGLEIMGLAFLEEVPLQAAEHLGLYRYEGGVTLIEIDTGFLSEPAPEIPPEDRIPADEIAALYRRQVLQYLLVPQGFPLPAGLEKEFIRIEYPLARVCDFTGNAPEPLRLPAGTPEEPDYRSMILNRIQAVLADETMLDAIIGTATDRFATLGIPVIFDCSALEKTEQGQKAWEKLYSLLFEGEKP